MYIYQEDTYYYYYDYYYITRFIRKWNRHWKILLEEKSMHIDTNPQFRSYNVQTLSPIHFKMLNFL